MIPFLFSPLGRLAASAAVLLIAWAAFAHHYENKGASRVTARIEKRLPNMLKLLKPLAALSLTLPLTACGTLGRGTSQS